MRMLGDGAGGAIRDATKSEHLIQIAQHDVDGHLALDVQLAHHSRPSTFIRYHSMFYAHIWLILSKMMACREGIVGVTTQDGITKSPSSSSLSISSFPSSSSVKSLSRSAS